MKKHIHLVVIFLAVFSMLRGQQIGPITQFSADPFFYNPAAAGEENNLEAAMGYRSQWSGMEGSPKTFFMSAHKAFLSSGTKGSSNKVLKGHVQNQDMFTKHNTSKFELKHGVGANFNYEEFGAFNRTNFGLAYAYHIPMKHFSISVGLGAGVASIALDPEESVLLENNDATYSTYLGMGGATTYLNLNAGFYLYSKNYYLGYASDQLFPGKVLFNSSDAELALNTHHYFMAGGSVGLNENFALQPNLLIGVYSGLPTTWHLNTLVVYDNMYEGGIGVRRGDALTVQLGYRWKQKIKMGYAYDINLSSLNPYNGGSHELLLVVSL